MSIIHFELKLNDSLANIYVLYLNITYFYEKI